MESNPSSCYHVFMRKKTLAQTNPYLKDPALRKRLLLVSAVTSTAIEGVHLKVSLKSRKKTATSARHPVSATSA